MKRWLPKSCGDGQNEIPIWSNVQIPYTINTSPTLPQRFCQDRDNLLYGLCQWARNHSPMNIAVQRRLGGTSNLWGGRCVTLDALDFEPRPVLNQSSWPSSAADLTPFLPAACDYLGCGEAVFENAIPSLESIGENFRVMLNIYRTEILGWYSLTSPMPTGCIG